MPLCGSGVTPIFITLSSPLFDAYVLAPSLFVPSFEAVPPQPIKLNASTPANIDDIIILFFIFDTPI